MSLPTATPCLLLDKATLLRNCMRMSGQLAKRGVRLRPHMKTAKSAEVARVATRGHFGGITVSTIAEADHFFEHGIRDITYAVGMVAPKLAQAARLARAGCRLSILTDDLTSIFRIAKAAEKLSARFPVLIEIDCGGERGGIKPTDPSLLKIAATTINARALEFEGVLTHGGHAYHATSIADIREAAEDERTSVVTAVRRLADRGIACPVVSTGSTPTATYAVNVDGINEMRPGVYMLGDLDQVALGTCVAADVAATVLTTVIGHNANAGRIIVDAGALALSKDAGVARHVAANADAYEAGFGTVVGDENLFVRDVNQEHGLIAARDGLPPFARYPLGSQIRILPNHVCMTAAGYDRYFVIEDDEVVDQWPRATGW